MDLYDIRGARLDVITEEVLSGDEEEVQRALPAKEPFVVAAEGGAAAARSAFQRFSVDTNESLSFEAYVPSDEEEPPSPTTARDGHDDVFEDEPESLMNTTRSKLQEKVAEMENFASHLEEIFLTVEENFGRQEQHLEQHYNDVLQTLSQRYDERAAALEEEKKGKLEALYAQLLGCGATMDTSKELIETAQQLYRSQDKRLFLQGVMSTVKRIKEFAKEDVDLTLSASLEFDTPLADMSDVKTMMDSINVVPAPSAPVINPQAPNSATRTSLRVCWSLFSDDTVEFYQLYYRTLQEDTPTQNTSGPEVSMVKVKETHCTVGDLLPNAQYEFWVTATNTTGISPASEKALYMTVPSPPVIKRRECTSCPEASLIRWESGNTNPVDSYTVELSEMGADGGQSGVTESIVAIPTCECLIQLRGGRRYLVSVRAVNTGGPSERSDAHTVSTTGTFFHLLEDTAHPCLSISEDGFTMFYGDEELPLGAMAFDDNTFARCVAVLGDMIPVRGRHYWEVEVEEGTEYRVGVAYEDTQRNSYLGGNNTSWCMRHILTPSRHKFEFLHSGWSPDIRITVNPLRIGLSLDYERGTLSFFNVELEQHLHTFHCLFQHYVHPCFALDNPGALTLHNGVPAPGYVALA